MVGRWWHGFPHIQPKSQRGIPEGNWMAPMWTLFSAYLSGRSELRLDSQFRKLHSFSLLNPRKVLKPQITQCYFIKCNVNPCLFSWNVENQRGRWLPIPLATSHTEWKQHGLKTISIEFSLIFFQSLCFLTPKCHVYTPTMLLTICRSVWGCLPPLWTPVHLKSLCHTFIPSHALQNSPAC